MAKQIYIDGLLLSSRCLGAGINRPGHAVALQQGRVCSVVYRDLGLVEFLERYGNE